MNRILSAGLLYFVASAPVIAACTSLHPGLLQDNTSENVLRSYQTNKMYATETLYTKTATHISRSDVPSETSIAALLSPVVTTQAMYASLIPASYKLHASLAVENIDHA